MRLVHLIFWMEFVLLAAGDMYVIIIIVVRCPFVGRAPSSWYRGGHLDVSGKFFDSWDPPNRAHFSAACTGVPPPLPEKRGKNMAPWMDVPFDSWAPFSVGVVCSDQAGPPVIVRP